MIVDLMIAQSLLDHGSKTLTANYKHHVLIENRLSMVSLPIPQSPNYRVTLFYGPEPVEGRSVQCCVFNVKKRSWKAGVQVAVEIEDQQFVRALAELRFEDWLGRILKRVAADERASYERRAQELLRQALAALKLDLAIQGGLSQENQRVEGQSLVTELDRRIPECGDQLKSEILAGLDVEAP
jgi:hypothetical protein